ncbi:MAG TPA: flagellar protein FlbB [Spirochaetia bacterium]|nr:flagellar protein FlbB [Spirochaetia bacterium]
MRIFVLILLVLVLFIGGLLWFDYLDLIDARTYLDPIFGPLLEAVGLRHVTKIEDPEDPLLLDKERIRVQMESLALIKEELDHREDGLNKRKAELDQMFEGLLEKEKALEDREKSFNERLNAYENRRVNLEQKVQYFVGMPPEKAVAMMLEYANDMDLIDIFRMADELASRAGETSLVAYWLSLMPPERGAELTRKMGKAQVEAGGF